MGTSTEIFYRCGSGDGVVDAQIQSFLNGVSSKALFPIIVKRIFTKKKAAKVAASKHLKK